MRLDLGSIQSTKDFVRAFKEKNLPLHILINNAGIALLPFSKFNICFYMYTSIQWKCRTAMTDEGHEMHYQVNHPAEVKDLYTKCYNNRFYRWTTFIHSSSPWSYYPSSWRLPPLAEMVGYCLSPPLVIWVVWLDPSTLRQSIQILTTVG